MSVKLLIRSSVKKVLRRAVGRKEGLGPVVFTEETRGCQRRTDRENVPRSISHEVHRQEYRQRGRLCLSRVPFSGPRTLNEEGTPHLCPCVDGGGGGGGTGGPFQCSGPGPVLDVPTIKDPTPTPVSTWVLWDRDSRFG